MRRISPFCLFLALNEQLTKDLTEVISTIVNIWIYDAYSNSSTQDSLCWACWRSSITLQQPHPRLVSTPGTIRNMNMLYILSRCSFCRRSGKLLGVLCISHLWVTWFLKLSRASSSLSMDCGVWLRLKLYLKKQAACCFSYFNTILEPY